MAVGNPTELKDGGADNLVNTSAETHYTVPTNTKAFISKFILHNTDPVNSIPVTISVGAASAANTRFLQTLLPNESVDVTELTGATLAAGATIVKQATTTADMVNIYVYGNPIT